MKRHQTPPKLAQPGVAEAGHDLLTPPPVCALELCEQCLVGMAVEAPEDLLLDRRRRRGWILGEARGQRL